MQPTDLPAPARALVLFDGVCNFCNGSVRFIMRRDRARRFAFAALQSEAGRRLAGETVAEGADLQSIVLLEEVGRFTRSTAALRIARHLAWPWPLGYGLIVVPRPLRDWLYGAFARRRYRWFGKSEACMVPTAEQRARFLE